MEMLLFLTEALHFPDRLNISFLTSCSEYPFLSHKLFLLYWCQTLCHGQRCGFPLESEVSLEVACAWCTDYRLSPQLRTEMSGDL